MILGAEKRKDYDELFPCFLIKKNKKNHSLFVCEHFKTRNLKSSKAFPFTYFSLELAVVCFLTSFMSLSFPVQLPTKSNEMIPFSTMLFFPVRATSWLRILLKCQETVPSFAFDNGGCSSVFPPSRQTMRLLSCTVWEQIKQWFG